MRRRSYKKRHQRKQRQTQRHKNERRLYSWDELRSIMAPWIDAVLCNVPHMASIVLNYVDVNAEQDLEVIRQAVKFWHVEDDPFHFHLSTIVCEVQGNDRWCNNPHCSRRFVVHLPPNARRQAFCTAWFNHWCQCYCCVYSCRRTDVSFAGYLSTLIPVFQFTW